MLIAIVEENFKLLKYKIRTRTALGICYLDLKHVCDCECYNAKVLLPLDKHAYT